ncbi:MAG: helix-turn-helix domain-containing protein [bacterium]
MTTTNNNLIATLKLVGLNESEAKVFLTCLELGPASAWNIYLKSGIKRPTCYAILENLVADGIASKTSDGQRTIFSVVRPEELLSKIDNKRSQFKESLPLFDAVQSNSMEKPKIRLYEGMEGLRQAYLLGLNQADGGDILVFGSANIWQRHNEANNAYIQERIRKNIELKVIFADTEENHLMLKNDSNELRQTRFLSVETYNPKVETEIFGNTVIYIAHSEKEPFATVIENQAIANDERQRFDTLWAIAKSKD